MSRVSVKPMEKTVYLFNKMFVDIIDWEGYGIHIIISSVSFGQ